MGAWYSSSRLRSDIADDSTVSNKRTKVYVGFNTLPNEVLVGISSYLDKTSCMLLAVGLTASSSSWRKSNWNIRPSEASRIVLSTAPSSYLEIQFGDDEKFLAAKISDADIGAYLSLAKQIPWFVPVTTLSLKNCINVVGYGLEPLRNSTYLQKIDLIAGSHEGNDSQYTSRLSEEAVIPILDSIIEDYPNVRDFGVSPATAMAIYNEVRGDIVATTSHRDVEPDDMSISTGFYADKRSYLRVTPKIFLFISPNPQSKMCRIIRPNQGYRGASKDDMKRQMKEHLTPVDVDEAMAIWNREFELADIPFRTDYQFSCYGRHRERTEPFYFTLPKHWLKQSQTVLRFLQNYNTMMNRTSIVCSNERQQQESPTYCNNICRGTPEKPWVNLSGERFGTFNLICDRYELCNNTFCVDCASMNELRKPCEKCSKKGCNKRSRWYDEYMFCTACNDCGYNNESESESSDESENESEDESG